MRTIVAGRSNCELCGKEAELRPYGPNGEFICFACGMKDEATTIRQFEKVAVLDLRDQGGSPGAITAHDLEAGGPVRQYAEPTIGNKIIGRLLLAKAELEHDPTTEKLHAYNEASYKAVCQIDAIQARLTALEAVAEAARKSTDELCDCGECISNLEAALSALDTPGTRGEGSK